MLVPHRHLRQRGGCQDRGQVVLALRLHNELREATHVLVTGLEPGVRFLYLGLVIPDLGHLLLTESVCSEISQASRCSGSSGTSFAMGFSRAGFAGRATSQ